MMSHNVAITVQEPMRRKSPVFNGRLDHVCKMLFETSRKG